MPEEDKKPEGPVGGRLSAWSDSGARYRKIVVAA
jgi:hypothetical protein